MAQIRKNDDIRIVIDGYPIERVMECSINREHDTFGPFISDVRYHSAAGKIRIELTTIDNTTLAFDVTGNTRMNDTSDYCIVEESDGTTIYVYGPLRKLIPSLFVDKDLLPWQLDYLRCLKQYHLRFKYWRDDEIFSNTYADYFHDGYQHGYKNGVKTGTNEGYQKGVKDTNDIRDKPKARR